MTICQTCGFERTECDCSFKSSDAIDAQGSGKTLNPFKVEPKLDPDSDNLLSCGDDGLLGILPDDILDPPRCQAYNNANISIPNDDGQVVDLNDENYDSTTTMHSNVTLNSRVVIPVDGIYICTFLCAFASNATGDRSAWIRKNGFEYMAMNQKMAVNGAETSLSVTVQDFLEAGEFIEAIAQQDSGGALNLLATAYSPILTVQYRRRNPDA